jgi:hypothetical protein
VWLSHDPAHFGILAARPVPGRPAFVEGAMRALHIDEKRRNRALTKLVQQQ